MNVTKLKTNTNLKNYMQHLSDNIKVNIFDIKKACNTKRKR